MQRTLSNILGASAMVLVCATLFLAQTALGWVGPSQTPTGGNISAPVNVGSTAQTKNGTLGVNGLAVFGNTLLSGSSRYLNWGTTAGSSGYGLRDNAGTMEFKNSGGSWTAMGSGSGTTWLASGNNIYNTNTGNVGIGTASPSQKLDVSGTVRATAFLYSSDARLKTEVSPLSDNFGKISALSPVSFVWKEGAHAGKYDIGFIAQDVEKIVPEIVNTDATGMKSVDYARLVPILVGALQEQQEKIETLETRIRELEAR